MLDDKYLIARVDAGASGVRDVHGAIATVVQPIALLEDDVVEIRSIKTHNRQGGENVVRVRQSLSRRALGGVVRKSQRLVECRQGGCAVEYACVHVCIKLRTG